MAAGYDRWVEAAVQPCVHHIGRAAAATVEVYPAPVTRTLRDVALDERVGTADGKVLEMPGIGEQADRHDRHVCTAVHGDAHEGGGRGPCPDAVPAEDLHEEGAGLGAVAYGYAFGPRGGPGHVSKLAHLLVAYHLLVVVHVIRLKFVASYAVKVGEVGDGHINRGVEVGGAVHVVRILHDHLVVAREHLSRAGQGRRVRRILGCSPLVVHRPSVYRQT